MKKINFCTAFKLCSNNQFTIFLSISYATPQLVLLDECVLLSNYPVNIEEQMDDCEMCKQGKVTQEPK